ncbi:MAG: tetratricopeptide repeat protein [Acidobacteria bacterium]|nr:tetratricopeptide repeat protein [Acidobacteriota bacterium]
MDIPSIRFLFPCLVLYFFYWALVVNPFMEDPTLLEESQPGRLSQEETRRLLDKSLRLIEEKNYEQALGSTLQLYHAYPENSIYIHQLANLYNTLGRHEDEAAMWELFMQFAPLPVEGCPQIGLAYRKLNREPDAFKSFERCLAIEENSDNLMYMAHGLERRKEYAKAQELYERALKRAPDYTDVAIGLARVELFLGNPKKAKERILGVLERAPDNVDALLVAGLAFSRGGDATAARRYLEKGIELRPGDRDFRVALARARRNRPVWPGRNP